eukprot:1564617-Rhodomonas_salina.1
MHAARAGKSQKDGGGMCASQCGRGMEGQENQPRAGGSVPVPAKSVQVGGIGKMVSHQQFIDVPSCQPAN